MRSLPIPAAGMMLIAAGSAAAGPAAAGTAAAGLAAAGTAAAGPAAAEPDAGPAAAEPAAEPAAGPAGRAGAAEAWPRITVAPGLQMWRPVAAHAAGTFLMEPVIGGVVKTRFTFTERLGAHLRLAYGANRTTAPAPVENQDATAMAVGAGFDVLKTLGRDVLWANTMGVAAQRARLTIGEAGQPATTSYGLYFVTELDVTLFGPMGFWMDWGCQVVGPSSADVTGGRARTWDINPLGAGGMRIAL